MKILVFTGSRGEWGYLRPVIKNLVDRGIEYLIVASNMHIDPLYGDTHQEIIKDGFLVSEKIPMNISYESDFSWCRSLGILAMQIPGILERAKPDLILLAGDRAETTIFAALSYYTTIPIAHIQAGELSGHKDGMARHAIGKFCHIHFASNKDAYDRLIRLGEEPFRVFQTGAPQIDDLLDKDFSKSGRGVLEYLKIPIRQKFALCIFHGSSDEQFNLGEKVREVDEIINEKGYVRIWILPNNDSGSNQIKNEIINLTSPMVRIARNLPRNQYAFLLKRCEFIIGNSSSGILEAPAVGTLSINIGKRQTGRVQAKTVKQITKYSLKEIKKAVDKAVDERIKLRTTNYGTGKSAKKIVDVILSLDIKSSKLINKYLNE